MNANMTVSNLLVEDILFFKPIHQDRYGTYGTVTKIDKGKDVTVQTHTGYVIGVTEFNFLDLFIQSPHSVEEWFYRPKW